MTPEQQAAVLEEGIREAYALGRSEGLAEGRRKGILEVLDQIEGPLPVDAEWIARNLK